MNGFAWILMIILTLPSGETSTVHSVSYTTEEDCLSAAIDLMRAVELVTGEDDLAKVSCRKNNDWSAIIQ